MGLLVDANSCLHLYVNGMDQGVAAQDIPSPCYPFIDLYGQCEQVSATHGNMSCQFVFLVFSYTESCQRSKVRVLVSCLRSISKITV